MFHSPLFLLVSLGFQRISLASLSCFLPRLFLSDSRGYFFFVAGVFLLRLKRSAPPYSPFLSLFPSLISDEPKSFRTWRRNQSLIKALSSSGARVFNTRFRCFPLWRGVFLSPPLCCLISHLEKDFLRKICVYLFFSLFSPLVPCDPLPLAVDDFPRLCGFCLFLFFSRSVPHIPGSLGSLCGIHSETTMFKPFSTIVSFTTPEIRFQSAASSEERDP